jgi:hypothetical protein
MRKAVLADHDRYGASTGIDLLRRRSRRAAKAEKKRWLAGERLVATGATRPQMVSPRVAIAALQRLVEVGL